MEHLLLIRLHTKNDIIKDSRRVNREIADVILVVVRDKFHHMLGNVENITLAY